jgi:hypothetical protein
MPRLVKKFNVPWIKQLKKVKKMELLGEARKSRRGY